VIGPETILLAAFALSLLLTLAAERVAPRVGLVARPAADRWHRQTVPLLGGAAIMIATVIPTLVVLPGSRNIAVLAITASVMGLVGLVDDVRRLSPQRKLLAQLLLASVLLYFGFALRLTGYPLVDVFLTLFWIVGITNAFNLLDNMDGLSGAIAIVTAAFWLLFFHWDGDGRGVLVAAAFIGAVAGFLVRNFPPAKIFMGDAGSLFIGFFLAGLSATAAGGPYSRGVAAVLVIPVLLLLIPIFDTAFVTATRLLAGRSVAAGGRDHTSHRLVAIGLTDRKTVLLLSLISAAAGGVAVLSYRAGLSQAVVLLALLVIGLVLLGIHLSRVRVVHSVEQQDAGAVLRLLADFQYKRQVLTLVLDVGLIVLAYYAAYLIRFEDAFDQHRDLLYGSLPAVLAVQLLVLAAFGLYRGIWQYTGVADVLRIVKAATAAVMVTMIVLVYTHRFVGFSRTVFILDWLLLMVLIGGSRASFRFFGELFRPVPASFGRVLIYGAGDGGALVARELLNNPALGRVPIGFVDDDRSKHRTSIYGLPVLGGSDQVESIIRDRRVSEVIVSSAQIQGNGLESVREVCDSLQVPLRRAALRLE
jgi:UDP-GlcNAc:undecaprenyl-phosphate GlcNAc-1-phosphate transferase